jgi:proteasome beta subunit
MIRLIKRPHNTASTKKRKVQRIMSNPDQAQYPYIPIPGATTIGVVFKDGVILAAEKRVSYGYFIMSKGGKKVFKIADSIGAACAGLVSDMQILIRDVEAYTNLYRLDAGRSVTVKATAKIMSNLLFNSRYMPLITQTIVGGIDDEGASLYVLDVLGSLIPDKYATVGTGAEIAIGVIEEGFKENMSQKEAKDLVMRAVKSAISRDSMSGNGVDFLIITKEGIEEETAPF